MHYRDNKIQFTSLKNPITKATFTVLSFSITNGQDPKGNIKDNLTVTTDSDMNLNFEIGRKGSADVANWFERLISPNQNTFYNNPGSLNFALYGTLSLTFKTPGYDTYVFSNIMLAQGHAGASNNWWFGGAKCNNVGDHTVKCKDDNDKIEFSFIRGGNDGTVVNEVLVSYPD